MPIEHDRTWTITGQRLAELLRATRGPFLRTLQLRRLSREYVRQARFITTELADFCAEQEAATPWQLREAYLAQRGGLRVQQRYSSFYLETDGRELRYFLRWYEEQLAFGNLALGELSAEQWQTYWSTQQGALPYRHVIMSRHLRPLLLWLQQQPMLDLSGELDVLLRDYFAQRHLVMRGQGYGFVLNHRANIVTRRHLVWLEGQGHLPVGTAAPDSSAPVARVPEALFHHLVARVGAELPQGLRQPLTESRRLAS